MKAEEWHRMGRRSLHNDYRKPGMYHITIKVNDRFQQILGHVTGNLIAPDNTPDAPRVNLSAVGVMVREELLGSITAHYPMVEVEDYVVMPDHLHFIVAVRNSIISRQGRETHLGQVIAGFKKGCNRRFWSMTGQGEQNVEARQGEPATAADMRGAAPPKPKAATTAADMRGAVPPQPKRTASTATTGRTPLFNYGYVDVMPLHEGQLEQQRVYIRNNPRNRLMRMLDRERLHLHRADIDTALSLAALKGYLHRECRPNQISDDTWIRLQKRLLVSATNIIICDSYGDRQLLSLRLLPVVCHRSDVALRKQQQELCLRAAAEGAVLVSACIAEGERHIIDAAISSGYPVVTIEDNGFNDLFHPSERRMSLCTEGKLLIVTPWKYHYRGVNESINVAECKTMNCIVQALCHCKDSWWKHTGTTV